MHLSPEIKHFQRRKTGLPILRKQLKSFFLQFPKKKSGGVDTAQTIKASFLSLKTSKNRWNLGFQPVHMRDHRNRGGRFCANNSTSIRTRLRQKIDKNNDEILGLCLLRITGHHKNIESPCPLFEARIANIFGNLSWLVLCCIEVDSDVVALLSYAHLPIATTGRTKYDQAH